MYKLLEEDLKKICFPFDFNKEIFIYKLFVANMPISNKNNSEDRRIMKEYSIENNLLRKTYNQEIIVSEFDFFIDMMYSNNEVVQSVNYSIKSLLKIAFNRLFKNDYQNTQMILKDIIKIMERESERDLVLYKRVHKLHEALSSKLIGK